MRTAVLLTVVAACLLISGSVLADANRVADVRVLSEYSSSLDWAATASSGTDRLPQDCHGEWHGTTLLPWQGWFRGHEYYAVYQDPNETGCTDTYPFSVMNVYCVLGNPNPGVINIPMRAVVFTADWSNPECPRPGVVVRLGPVVDVPLDPSSFTMVTLPIDSCCVDGPYFAGVYCPIMVEPGIIDIVIDDPTDIGQPPLRPCASYNNPSGMWMDMVMDFQVPGNLKLWSDGESSALNECDGCVLVVEQGVDLWVTERDGDLVGWGVFSPGMGGTPLPADFFGPGSDPFDGIIALTGSPLTPNPPYEFGNADAIIERKESAALPDNESTDMVEIELVALNLLSTIPITVSYDGGAYFEEWDVHVCLSEIALVDAGSMVLMRDCCLGGEFNATLAFYPKFIFTAIQSPQEMILDYGLAGYPPLVTTSSSGKWSVDMHPPFDVMTSPGLVELDQDCNPATPDIYIGPSSKFQRCENTISHPCHFSDPCAECCGLYTGGYTGNANCDVAGKLNLSDITATITRVYIDPDTPLCCEANGDVNCDTKINLSDITNLITKVYLDTLFELCYCP